MPVPYKNCTSSSCSPLADCDESLADDLDQDALRSASIELAVEDPLPGAEVQASFRDCHDDFAAPDNR